MKILDIFFYVLFAGLLAIGLVSYYHVGSVSLPEPRTMMLIYSSVAGIALHTVVLICDYIRNR